MSVRGAGGAPRFLEASRLRLQLFEWGGAARAPAPWLAAHRHGWDRTAPLLAEDSHVAALDFRATAPATGGSARHRFAEHGVVAVLDGLGWTAPLVTGRSMGGHVGACLAARLPTRPGVRDRGHADLVN